jgi:gluconate 2-dehydrogenase subunit 3-like protein
VSPPMIHAGGPFSDRAGARHDDFEDFVPLDEHAELGWRIRLEGTRGLREREFAGPVRGLQQVYREGLAHLDERARSSFAMDFASTPGPGRDLILSDQGDDRVQELVGAAFGNALEAMYGPPEYGGNRGGAGWRYTNWPGDRQPRGYSDAHVSGPAASGRRLSAATAASLDVFVPALRGHRPGRDAFWLRRRRLLGP